MSQFRPSPAHVRGAVDLSSLGRTPTAPADAPAVPEPGTQLGADAARVVVDVTEATFGEVVELSRHVPVVVDLWATWCGPCTQLSPILERLAVAYGGRFLLAKVDVDANPQIATAFQVQSIPTVVALVAGQPVPMFQGAYPEAQVRQIIDELLRVAVENGVTGVLGEQTVADAAAVDGAAEPAEPELPPLHQAAYDALENDDLDGAAAAFGQALKENPRDDEARAGLAQVELLRRLMDADAGAVLAAASSAAPDDVEAHLAAADIEVASGRASAGLGRLVALVAATRGPERERARVRVIELFEVVGTASPEVTAARRALATALY